MIGAPISPIDNIYGKVTLHWRIVPDHLGIASGYGLALDLNHISSGDTDERLLSCLPCVHLYSHVIRPLFSWRIYL